MDQDSAMGVAEASNSEALSAAQHVAPASEQRKRPGSTLDGCWVCPAIDPPPCCPVDCPMDPEVSDYDQELGERSGFGEGGDSPASAAPFPAPSTPPGIAATWGAEGAGRLPAPSAEATPEAPAPPKRPLQPWEPRKPEQIPCCAGGRRPQESNFEHCPTPQSFVRCGPHHRAELCVLSKTDVQQLTDLWWRYHDDLSRPWYEKKPQFSDRDYAVFRGCGQKVVDALVEEYRQPMVLDQATISNTNHIGHPPHADNVQFDSVWWKGKRIRSEDEVVAAQEGAYVLWRSEKTSYRSYSCSTSLCDPNGYEGGEVQFFAKWGDKDPIASYKCAEGCAIAFCGCQRNIHAVTGVRSGFRLVFLVWTRPPDARVPENQTHVCYFRPGTGLGVWLTTSDMMKHQARKRGRDSLAWMPVEEDDGTCQCVKCVKERRKLAWKDCFTTFKAASAPTPTTSAGTSPRTSGSQECGSSEGGSAASGASGVWPRDPQRHCPHPQGAVRCQPHERVELSNVLTKADMKRLNEIWKAHQDDLSSPWYEKKPIFSDQEFRDFRRIAQKAVDAMAAAYRQPLELDQATISNTNHLGHPPHADNVQFDSVWWGGRQIKQTDELIAARGGAEVLWREAKTGYRNYSASISLSDPSEYGGGDLEFYGEWGQKDPIAQYRCQPGSGVAFCGCQRNIHAVTGVKWGQRLVLLIWTRPPKVTVPEDQKHVCYFRPGTGLSVWLTTADLEHYPTRRQRRQTWVPIVNKEEEDKEDGGADADGGWGEHEDY